MGCDLGFRRFRRFECWALRACVDVRLGLRVVGCGYSLGSGIYRFDFLQGKASGFGISSGRTYIGGESQS